MPLIYSTEMNELIDEWWYQERRRRRFFMPEGMEGKTLFLSFYRNKKKLEKKGSSLSPLTWNTYVHRLKKNKHQDEDIQITQTDGDITAIISITNIRWLSNRQKGRVLTRDVSKHQKWMWKGMSEGVVKRDVSQRIRIMNTEWSESSALLLFDHHHLQHRLTCGLYMSHCIMTDLSQNMTKHEKGLWCWSSCQKWVGKGEREKGWAKEWDVIQRDIIHMQMMQFKNDSSSTSWSDGSRQQWLSGWIISTSSSF